MTGFSGESKHLLKYGDMSSVSMPQQHSPDIPVSKKFSSSSSFTVEDNEAGSSSVEILPYQTITHLTSQSELNDLVRDLNYTKQNQKYFILGLQTGYSKYCSLGKLIYRSRFFIKPQFHGESMIGFCRSYRKVFRQS